VQELHRIAFSGLTLKGLSEGNWAELSEREMAIIQDAVANAAGPGVPFAERAKTDATSQSGGNHCDNEEQ
jgi:hypothetical protein